MHLYMLKKLPKNALNKSKISLKLTEQYLELYIINQKLSFKKKIQ